MLFPMIDVEIPPTDYCLRMIPFFKFVLVLQLLLVVGGFVINDFWGALSLALVCLMGYFCLQGEMGISVTSCLYYTFIALMCAVFDAIRAVMYFQKSEYGLFSLRAEPLVHVAQVVMLFSPVCEFISGYMAWTFYKDCRGQIEDAAPRQPLLPRSGGVDYERYSGPPGAATESRPPRATQEANFRAFQGEGQRLGQA